MRFEYTAKIAKGDPRNPMSESEVTEKFRGNAQAVLPEERATNLVTVVQKLETVDNVQKLVTLLSPV
jgi:2-methylcitrate dehydratase PrpD